jgi:hypothetical protein
MRVSSYRGHTIRFSEDCETGDWYYTVKETDAAATAAQIARVGPFPSEVSARSNAQWRVDILTAEVMAFVR